MSRHDRDRFEEERPRKSGSTFAVVAILIGFGIVVVGGLAGLVVLGAFFIVRDKAGPGPEVVQIEPAEAGRGELAKPPVAKGSTGPVMGVGSQPVNRPSLSGPGSNSVPPGYKTFTPPGSKTFTPPGVGKESPTVPKAKYVLPALPAALPIKPPELAQDTVTRELPSPTDAIAIGGGGRFLILRLPSESKLAIFDVNEAKVVKYLPLAESGAHFTAGMTELVVALPKAHILQRWNLLTFEREAVAPIPSPGVVNGIRMGSASRGPLMICQEKDKYFRSDSIQFVDVATFKAMDLNLGENRGMPGAVARLVRASGDGRLFAWRTSAGAEGHDMASLVLEPTGAKVHSRGMGDYLLTPTPDGRFVVGISGAMSPDFNQVYPRPANNNLYKPFIPSVQGPYLLQLFSREYDNLPGHGRQKQGEGDVTILHRSMDFPLVTIKDVDGVTGMSLAYGSTGATSLVYEERVLFIPAAKVLLNIPLGNSRIVIRKLDLEAELEKSGKDYLLVTSEPSTNAKRGSTYRYPIVAKAKKSGIKYKLDSGPEGMKISADGIVTWMVPDKYDEKETDVIVTVSDSGGTEQFHTFKISVE